MANTSTIKSLVELIIKAISAIRKNQKRLDKTRIYDSIEIFLENCDIDDSLFWERMNYLEENEVIFNKLSKNGNLFYNSKRNQETSFSNWPNTCNKLSKQFGIDPQDLQDNLSLISNGIEISLDKFNLNFNLNFR